MGTRLSKIAMAFFAIDSASASANDPNSVVGDFDKDLDATKVGDSVIDTVSWSAGCGEACCDAVGVCGPTCCSCAESPCSKNCGMLDLGYPTHDPCGEWCQLPELSMGDLACKTERCFDEFISPMTNPIYFEDPRNVSELRGIFWNHNVPQAAGGGQINLYALQVRARLSDKLSLIATKDGYIVSSNPLVDDGWADGALGLKYALYRDAR